MTMLIRWASASSVLILAVALVRALLGRRMGAGLRYALWGLVLLRLLIPVQLFSVPVPQFAQEAPEPPQTQTIDPAPVYSPAGNGAPGVVVLTPAGQSSGAAWEDAPPAIYDTPHTPAAPATRPFDWRGALGWLWLGGAAAMGLALVFCNARFAAGLRRRRRPAGQEGTIPVYVAEGLESPCLFGVVRPAVYLTPEAAQNPTMLRHVLAHEATHARHGDQVWSLLRCAALAIHWWNPLVWLAAFLSRRDGELACDEGAIKLLGDGERKAYGWTLLTLITAQPSPVSLMNAATTMSGGKKALWERVQRIAHAPKKAVWAAVLAVVLALTVTACAFSSAAAPKEEPGEDPVPVTSASPEPAESEEPAQSEPPVLSEGSFGPEEAAATAQINGKTFTLTMDYKGGNPDGEVGGATFTVACGGKRAAFTDDWVEETPITLTEADLDGDGADEVVLAYTTSHLTGGLIQSLRVFDGATLAEQAAYTGADLPGVIFEQVKLTGKGDSYLLTAPGVEETIAKSEGDRSYPAPTDLMNTMVFGNYYAFTVEDGRLYCDLGIWQGLCGTVRVELGLEDGGLACKSFRYVPPAQTTPAAQIMPFTGSLDLEFTSGVGAWRTVLTLNGDGTFTGEFSDTDMGVPEEGYHTTRYICVFHGRFRDVERVNDHAWSMTLAELVLDTGRPIGEEWIVDGVQYISNAPYGLSAAGADAPPELGAKFMLYAPGATQRDTGADKEFYWWIHQGPQTDIPNWALHNLATDYGFLAG